MAVSPFESLRNTSAPLDTRRETIRLFLCMAATIRAVRPSDWRWWLMFAPVVVIIVIVVCVVRLDNFRSINRFLVGAIFNDMREHN